VIDGLYSVKPWFVAKLRRIEDWMVARHVSPDTLTWAAVVASALAGGALAVGGLTAEPRWWLLVPPLAVARLALNALDGSIARRAGTSTTAGGILNELGDRAADAALIVPAGVAAARPSLALGAIAATYLTSVTGILGTTVDGARLNGGPMGKADRVAVLAVAALAGGVVASPRPIEIGLWTIAAGCLVTVANRARILTIRARRDHA
jgi:CDP-diacylglycerol--glycerol-3-phosphate 3-phosphatidyltransferase